MVCKEDVLSWFKDLECYKRINVMFELLNMCVPFEVRFLGSCIEEIGKHSYQELRGPAIIANDLEKLSKDSSLQTGLLDETTRHRILIYISLLSARNCACANWYFKNLLRTDSVEEYLVKGGFKDETVISEFVLLYTLGVHHPAFSYEQKRFFSDILLSLLSHKEGKKRLSPKPTTFSYPPGFGYPTTQKPLTLNPSEVPVIPIKTASPVGFVESAALQHPPPGLPPHPVVPPHAPLEMMQPQLWTRTVFAATSCGAPEVPPFPPQPVSPLVSQAASPLSSRAGSPHRTFSIRSNVPNPVMTQVHPPMEVLPPGAPTPLPPPLPLDMSQPPPSLPHIPVEAVKNPDEEINHIPCDKMREPFLNSGVCELKHLNGMHRFPAMHKYPAPYLIEQMQGLSLDGENSLHRSSSSSSSSLNPSPPETPNVTPAGTPHGPGRGENSKPRLNGIPPFGAPISAGLCDGSQPPPPPPFSNCSVPYSSCYQVNLAPIPNRSMFPHYSQPIRPPFTTAYTTYENVYPYVPLLYSSLPAPPAPAPSRPLNCYNCGALGHDATDCTGQTIEEITQKAYSLEYAPIPPEQDKTT